MHPSNKSTSTVNTAFSRTFSRDLMNHVRKINDFSRWLYSAQCVSQCWWNLRWMKEWICSERPITICAIVNAWLCQGPEIWLRRDITRRQRPIRALASFTLHVILRTNMHRTRLLCYLLQPACPGWPARFISTCFYSSKMKCYLLHRKQSIALLLPSLKAEEEKESFLKGLTVTTDIMCWCERHKHLPMPSRSRNINEQVIYWCYLI